VLMKTISIILPVYMEAGNVAAAVEGATWAVNQAGFDDYEMMIIDCLREDGTHDGTPEIADALAKKDQHIRVFHNSYINLGRKFWLGVDNAHFPYVVMVAGDNELARESIRGVIAHTGEADIIMSYTANMEIRPLMRRVISRTFTFLTNLIVGLHLRYYNGMCVHKTENLRKIKERNDSFAYSAEILAQLIRAGYSHKEVPMILKKRDRGKPTAFKMKNVIGVSRTLFKLFWKYRIKGAQEVSDER